jgi:hypothetical protein
MFSKTYYRWLITVICSQCRSDPQNKTHFPNPYLPEYNFHDPSNIIEKSIKFENLLEQIND